jgi:hypothetical protein
MSSEPRPSQYSARPCPVCGASAPEPVFRQQFQGISGASLMPGYDVVLCGDCGFAYADNIPTQQVFDAYYRDLSKYEYHQRHGRITDSDRRRFEGISTLIQPYITRHSRILDVGCANGALLAELKQRGFANVFGLDPSPACADAARRFYDIPVTVGSLAEARRAEPGGAERPSISPGPPGPLSAIQRGTPQLLLAHHAAKPDEQEWL